MKKRIMAFVLVLAMVCMNLCTGGTYGMQAYAEGTDAEEPGISVKTVEEAKAGELVTIEVVANKDMYWNSFNLGLCLNADKLKAGKDDIQAIEENYDSTFGEWLGWKSPTYKGRIVQNFVDTNEQYGDHCYLVGGVVVEKDKAKIEKDTVILSLKAEAKVDLKEGDTIATFKLPGGYTTSGEGGSGDTKHEVGLAVDCMVVKPEEVTITFETNGGDAMQPIPVRKGETLGEIAEPTRQGYLFAGWYTDSACETAFDETTPVEADVTLYAKWEKDIPIDVNDFVIENGVLQKYIGKAEEVVIPEGVTQIKSGAFENCSHVTYIKIPASVTQINNSSGFGTLSDPMNGETVITTKPQGVFSGCSKLQTIQVAKENDTYAIYGDCLYEKSYMELICCPAQKEQVNLPDNTRWIANGAFYGCSKLKSIHIPENVSWIQEGAFWECSSLESIEIPEGVTSIGAGTFFGCSSLKSVHIPDSITRIDEVAFYGCDKLSDIHIPEKTTSIGYSAFYNCKSLESIKIPEGITNIGYNTFSRCSMLADITIPESVTSIGGGAFYGTKWLEEQRKANPFVIVNHILIDGNTTNYDKKNVIIPDGVTCIGEGAFNHMFNGSNFYKTRVTLPDSVTEIASFAFGNCGNLVRIHIPRNVTKIAEYAFNTYQLNMTIYGEEGSYAQTYANMKQIPFKLLGNREDIVSAEEMRKFVEKNKVEDAVVETSSGVKFIFEKGSFLDNIVIDESMEFDFGTEIDQDYSALITPPFAEDALAFRIDYNYEGQLPGKAKIAIPVDDKFIGERLYYYEIGENGEYQYMGRTTVAQDGTYTVEQEHCSAYVATTKAPENLGNVDGQGGITTDDALIILKQAVGVPQTGYRMELADCDGADGITTDDALLVLKRAVGMEVELF